jgi:hypothetical protein
MLLEGLGIINPPTSAEGDLKRYPKEKTICYEIKSGGKVGEQIHWFFFSRMSTGAITFPIKLAEAVNLYGQNKTFAAMSMRKQHEFLMPFKQMDRAEEELKNLDIANTSDQMSNSLRIVRRNQAIQKDFFSMFEYLVWAVNQYLENDYYKTKQKKKQQRRIAFFD